MRGASRVWPLVSWWLIPSASEVTSPWQSSFGHFLPWGVGGTPTGTFGVVDSRCHQPYSYPVVPLVAGTCFCVGAPHTEGDSVCCKAEIGFVCLLGLSGLLLAQHRNSPTYYVEAGKTGNIFAKEGTSSSSTRRAPYPPQKGAGA